MSHEEFLPRLPVREGTIIVDLTGVYPRRKDAPTECRVEVFRVPTEFELYNNQQENAR